MKLILLLLLISCGMRVDVNPRPLQVNHTIDFDGIFDFCESLGGTNEEVDQCKKDILAAIGSAARSD